MKPEETIYIEIWKIEQNHSRTRWIVTTFFLSVSFAILGISFQSQGNQISNILGVSLPVVQRITGLLIFWFGYVIFVLFNRYTNILRNQLRNMEKQNLVSFKIQLEVDEFKNSKIKAAFSAKRLLFYFGLLYTVIVILSAFAKP